MKKILLLLTIIFVAYRGYVDWFKFSHDTSFINNKNKSIIYNLTNNDSKKFKELSFAFSQIVEKKSLSQIQKSRRTPSAINKKLNNNKLSGILTNDDVIEVNNLLSSDNPISNSLKLFVLSQRYLNKFSINERSQYFKKTIQFAQKNSNEFFKYANILMSNLDDLNFNKQKKIIIDLLAFVPGHKEEIREIAYNSLKYNIENNEDSSMFDISSLNLIIKSTDNEEVLLSSIVELTSYAQNNFLKNKLINIVSNTHPKLKTRLLEQSGLSGRNIANVDDIPEGIEFFEAIEFHEN